MKAYSKESQNEAPSDFAKPARFWGVMGLRAFFVRCPYTGFIVGFERSVCGRLSCHTGKN
jgi:hypothetical protein